MLILRYYKYIYLYIYIYLYCIYLQLLYQASGIKFLSQLVSFTIPLSEVPIRPKDSTVSPTPWIFRKTNQLIDLSLLTTPMSGKVLDTAPKAKAKAKAKPKTKTGRKKGGNGQTETEEHAPASAAGQQIDEPNKLDDNVALSIDGVVVTRTKYFVDCLFSGVRAALAASRQQFHLPVGSQPMEPQAKMNVGDLVYHEHEYLVLRKCLGMGLDFLFTKQLIIEEKVYSRWSAVRPQLQKVAMTMCHAATWVQICFDIMFVYVYWKGWHNLHIYQQRQCETHFRKVIQWPVIQLNLLLWMRACKSVSL